MADAEEIQDEKADSLSDKDLHRLLPGVPVTLYKNLMNATLTDITDDRGRGVLLFTEEETPTTIQGHWFAILPQDGAYLVFDPYGGTSTDPWRDGVNFVTKYELKALGQERPMLDDVFKRAGVRVTFNTTKFQSKGNDVSTCGRHCAVRLWHADMDSPQYKAFIYSYGPDADATVTRMTEERLAN